MRSAFRHGPVARTDAPVVVSLTEFTARRLRDLPGIAWAGLGLRRGWWAMPGAIGVVLYVDPPRRIGGSLSIWESEADLRRFVRLPRHQAIVRAHRGRVVVRAASWTAERVDVAEILERREQWLGDDRPARS